MAALIYHAIVETNTNSTAEISLKKAWLRKTFRSLSRRHNLCNCAHTAEQESKNLYTTARRPRWNLQVARTLDFQSIQWSRTGGFECRSEGSSGVSLPLVAHCAFDFYGSENCRFNKMLVRKKIVKTKWKWVCGSNKIVKEKIRESCGFYCGLCGMNNARELKLSVGGATGNNTGQSE